MHIHPILIFVILIGSLIFAIYYNDRWQKLYPGEKGFVWGYFQAAVCFPAAIICLSLPFIMEETDVWIWIYFSVHGLIAPFVSYYLLRHKKRWAWVVVVVLQMNVINWIIDYFYGKNRWDEFR